MRIKTVNYGIAPTLPPSLKGGRERRHKQIARLRNKCAMTGYGHTELVSVSCGLPPSPAFQAPSPQVARGKIRSVGDMKQNSFTDKVYSLFTTHHSLINNDKDFSRFYISSIFVIIDLYKKNRTYKVLFFQLIYEEYLNEL